MNYAEPIIDRYNVIVGTVVAVLSLYFGGTLDFYLWLFAFECG